jgi:hypothetical protein
VKQNLGVGDPLFYSNTPRNEGISLNIGHLLADLWQLDPILQ